jgi:hypothetical protein
MRLISNHLRICERCAHEHELFQKAERLIAQLPERQPSPRVDRAILDMIAARSQSSTRRSASTQKDPYFPLPLRKHSRIASRLSLKWVALAALLVLVLLPLAYFVSNSNFLTPQSPTLTLPSNLSWDKYVLYQKQTMAGSQGQSYLVTSYHDMATDDDNTEVVVPGKIDLVVVKDTQKSLGLDMLHNVAQWGAPDWIQSDTSMFDLDHLRKDLQTGRATCLGQVVYKGQAVYRVRMFDKNILLLDMRYLPVNVLENVDSTGTGQPMFNALRWLNPSQVPTSTWDMTIPQDFSMGTLPRQP